MMKTLAFISSLVALPVFADVRSRERRRTL
jgi:hypothetical protein